MARFEEHSNDIKNQGLELRYGTRTLELGWTAHLEDGLALIVPLAPMLETLPPLQGFADPRVQAARLLLLDLIMPDGGRQHRKHEVQERFLQRV